MGQRRRTKLKRLTEKLLAIRQKLGLTQCQLATLLQFDKPVRIAQYECGVRRPELIVLLDYAKVGRISFDMLANDNVALKFRKTWKRPRNAKALLMQDRVNETGEQF